MVEKINMYAFIKHIQINVHIIQISFFNILTLVLVKGALQNFPKLFAIEYDKNKWIKE